MQPLIIIRLSFSCDKSMRGFKSPQYAIKPQMHLRKTGFLKLLSKTPRTRMVTGQNGLASKLT